MEPPQASFLLGSAVTGEKGRDLLFLQYCPAHCRDKNIPSDFLRNEGVAFSAWADVAIATSATAAAAAAVSEKRVLSLTPRKRMLEEGDTGGAGATSRRKGT